jgi:hypothetical protein
MSPYLEYTPNVTGRLRPGGGASFLQFRELYHKKSHFSNRHPYPTFSGVIYPSFQKSPIKPYENLFSHPFFFVVDFFTLRRFSGARAVFLLVIH